MTANFNINKCKMCNYSLLCKPDLCVEQDLGDSELILIDMLDIEDIDTRFISLILERFINLDKKIRLVNVNRKIQETLSLLRLEFLVEISHE